MFREGRQNLDGDWVKIQSVMAKHQSGWSPCIAVLCLAAATLLLLFHKTLEKGRLEEEESMYSSYCFNTSRPVVILN